MPTVGEDVQQHADKNVSGPVGRPTRGGPGFESCYDDIDPVACARKIASAEPGVMPAAANAAVGRIWPVAEKVGQTAKQILGFGKNTFNVVQLHDRIFDTWVKPNLLSAIRSVQEAWDLARFDSGLAPAPIDARAFLEARLAGTRHLPLSYFQWEDQYNPVKMSRTCTGSQMATCINNAAVAFANYYQVHSVEPVQQALHQAMLDIPRIVSTEALSAKASLPVLPVLPTLARPVKAKAPATAKPAAKKPYWLLVVAVAIGSGLAAWESK